MRCANRDPEIPKLIFLLWSIFFFFCISFLHAMSGRTHVLTHLDSAGENSRYGDVAVEVSMLRGPIRHWRTRDGTALVHEGLPVRANLPIAITLYLYKE